MKTLTAVLVVTVLVIHISGYLIQVPTAPTIDRPKDYVSTQSWLRVQKLLTPLFENVCDENKNLISSQGKIIKTGDFSKPDAVTNLEKLIAAGLLPKGEIFSEYNPEHMKELKIIYELLSSAKNFEIFYEAAVWARLNLNCGLYVNAIYMAIQNRKDTERFSIPAPYEVLPNYFIRKEVLVKASSIFAGQEITPSDGIRDEGNTYYLDANYTAMFYDNNDDSKLAYFREDIGLNSYYFLRKLRLSPWFNQDINGRYGENMYQMMKQFMARYNLERYANGLPETDSLNWDSLPDVYYDSELVYSDGNEFSHRTVPSDISMNEEIALLQTIENNILTVVSHMKLFFQREGGYNKTQILNHLMEILVTGERSYETLARQFLGKDRTNNRHLSVLEHYMTSLRDPMFWKINKKIVDLIDSALKLLPTYSRNELYFPGVEVVNIDVKKMMTAYDYFEFDVTDALKLDDSKSTFNVKIGQPRLNHKPFTVKLNISSLVAKKGLVKIYLGPKLMPGELAAKKNLFTLLDVFEINLKIGTNVISRSSDDMKHFASDFMSLKTIRKKMEDAEFGLDSLPLKVIESQIGYPSRLILPKGLPQGLPIQMFVFVAPFTKAGPSFTSSMEFNSAILSPGYPLDLMINDRQLFALPNALIKYVTVTQKGDNKVENYGGPGVTKQWYGTTTYDPSSRPNYSQNNRKSFDYNSNKRPSVNVENNIDTVNEFSTASDEDHYSVLPLKENFVPNAVFDENINDDTVSSSNFVKLDEDLHDYKDNKAKLEKKDYLAKKSDYSKYDATTTKEEDDSSSITTQSYEEIVADIKNQEKVVVNTPRLLKATNYDYSSKSKGGEPFDYKAKKAQFDKKDYSAKRGDYNKYRTTPPIEEKITTESAITSPINANDDDAIDNQDNLLDYTPRLLQSSKFDYSSKRKEFDYKAKKAQFDKKDYSAKRGDYTKYRTAIPKQDEATTEFSIAKTEYTDNLARVQLEKDINNLNLVSEIQNNDINIAENKDNDVNDDIFRNNLIDLEPFVFEVRKRTPTVYDYLFHTFDYENSPELKVYE
ncbi:hypothetical protein PYW08_004995 [Mythimna loreyi]|uniref:Uncharacterized protein n=1 Tax=Mythimna loreyi TaxID=667449 RepID=A0ACC2QFR5_9NEOP|nr:hypothetical protein PYW08_004995 [Mythimna loreyi]